MKKQLREEITRLTAEKEEMTTKYERDIFKLKAPDKSYDDILRWFLIGRASRTLPRNLRLSWSTKQVSMISFEK